MSPSLPSTTLAALRRRLLAILLFGLAGTASELVLTGHHEDVWEWIPLVAIALAMLASLALLVTRPVAITPTTRVFQLTMGLLILSGMTGSVLHYRANMEFKREMDPSLSGFPLFSSVIQAKAPPTLAPGTLVLLGILGLACVFRLDVGHPSSSS